MKSMRVLLVLLLPLLWPSWALAVESDVSAGVGRMLIGMLVVLCLIGVLAFFARKFLPGQAGLHHGVIRQVGGLTLSPRERVLVLEVNKRWLVVGLNGSQMTALADLPAPPKSEGGEALDETDAATGVADLSQIDMQASFASRLQQAMQHTLRQSVKSFNNKQ